MSDDERDEDEWDEAPELADTAGPPAGAALPGKAGTWEQLFWLLVSAPMLAGMTQALWQAPAKFLPVRVMLNFIVHAVWLFWGVAFVSLWWRPRWMISLREFAEFKLLTALHLLVVLMLGLCIVAVAVIVVFAVLHALM